MRIEGVGLKQDIQRAVEQLQERLAAQKTLQPGAQNAAEAVQAPAVLTNSPAASAKLVARTMTQSDTLARESGVKQRKEEGEATSG